MGAEQQTHSITQKPCTQMADGAGGAAGEADADGLCFFDAIQCCHSMPAETPEPKPAEMSKAEDAEEDSSGVFTDATAGHSGNRLGGGTSAGGAQGILDDSEKTGPKPEKMPPPPEMPPPTEMEPKPSKMLVPKPSEMPPPAEMPKAEIAEEDCSGVLTEHSGNRLGGGTNAGKRPPPKPSKMPPPTEMPMPKPSEMPKAEDAVEDCSGVFTDATAGHSGNRLGGGTSTGGALGILDGSGTTMPKPIASSTELSVQMPTEVN